MLRNPTPTQSAASTKVILSNWNRLSKNGTFSIKTRNEAAPPTTHLTALFEVDKIWKIFRVHDLFDRITAILDAINVVNAKALTSPSE